MWTGGECRYLFLDPNRVLHDHLHWVSMATQEGILKTTFKGYVFRSRFRDALGAVIGSVVYFEYGFVRIAEIATGLLFAFAIVAALILLVDCGRLREPAHRMFPSVIKASFDREALAEETSPLIKAGYPTRDSLGELPDYDEATTMQQPTGAFLSQSNNDYGSVR